MAELLAKPSLPCTRRGNQTKTVYVSGFTTLASIFWLLYTAWMHKCLHFVVQLGLSLIFIPLRTTFYVLSGNKMNMT